MDNLISIEVPEAAEKAFLTKIGEAAELLKPYIVTLSENDKANLLKLGDIKTPFVTRVLEYTVTDPEYAPRKFDQAEFERDIKALLIYNGLISAINKLAAVADDTRSLLANDSYDAALAYYRIVRAEAKEGDSKAKVIYDDLSKWFTSKTTSTDKTPRP